MSRALWVNKLLTATFPQTWMIARMTRWPLIGKKIDDWLFEGDDMILLPREKVIPVNQSVADPGQMCLPSAVVEHFINQARFHWIMNECICRAGMGCKNHPIDLGCIFLGKAAMQINPKIGRQASKDETLMHAKKCREAGLVHLIGKNKLDEVWLNVHPGNQLLTICNCCACCCIWNNIPVLAEDISRKVTRMPGVEVRVNDDCTGCGLCADEVCFADAIKMVEGKAIISDACRGCGRCVSVCDQAAIDFTISNNQFLEQSIERIAKVVDVLT